jgi:hypothetical protein
MKDVEDRTSLPQPASTWHWKRGILGSWVCVILREDVLDRTGLNGSRNPILEERLFLAMSESYLNPIAAHEPPLRLLTISNLFMRSCEHAALLQLAGGNEVALYDFGHFDQVIRDLQNPTCQYPRLVHFVGRRHKELALKYIFPRNNIARRRQPSIANLRVETTSVGADSPLLFSDSDPFASAGPIPEPTECHPVNPYPLSWSPHFDFTINDALHARLFFLLCDVVCVFVDDFPSLEDFAQQLVQWTRLGSTSNLTTQCRPQLFVVTSDSCVPPETADLRFEDFRHSVYEGCQGVLSDYFSSVQIFPLGGDHLSPLARYRRLREVIVSNSMDMFRVRQKNNVSFSSTHLRCFFDQALAHIAKSVAVPFNFLSASRSGNEVPENLTYHLTNFLRLGQESKIAHSDLVSNIASALLMDAYPPGMHRKFTCFSESYTCVDHV